MTPAADKAELRARMRALRRRLARESPDAAALAAAALPEDVIAAVKTATGYHPQGAELDPKPLMARLRKRSVACALPAGEGRDERLIFRLATPGAPTVLDAFGIPAPAPGAPVIAPDLLIVPLLAFDRTGGRLGQGAGAYDRTIAHLRGSRPILVLGLAYAGQEIEQVPAEPHDERLDGVLTETGYREFC